MQGQQMRNQFVRFWITFALAGLAIAQQAAPTKPSEPAPAEATKSAGRSPIEAFGKPGEETPENAHLKVMFEDKVKSEWDALKKKDAKAYGDLLAEDYEGIEVDGQGERTKGQALRELASGNVFDYTLWGFKLIPLGPDAAGVIYEVTLQFPPRSSVRYSRVYITELWVKNKYEWKLLHYQETRVK
jgi:hypothetical protein